MRLFNVLVVCSLLISAVWGVRLREVRFCNDDRSPFVDFFDETQYSYPLLAKKPIEFIGMEKLQFGDEMYRFLMEKFHFIEKMPSKLIKFSSKELEIYKEDEEVYCYKLTNVNIKSSLLNQLIGIEEEEEEQKKMENNSQSFPIMITLGLIVCILASAMIVKKQRNKTTNENLLSSTNSSLNQEESNHSKKELSSLAYHRVIPSSAKILVPFFIALNVALFITANSTIGASVEFKFRVLNGTLIDLSLFEFSLMNTIIDMWDAEVYILSLLVAVWSGLWVYTKLFLMTICWYVPPKHLKLYHRRRLLLALDALGKYCMLDSFLMVMMMVAFRFHITTDEIAYIKYILPSSFVVVDVNVNPKFGLYGFLTAAALSMVLTHVLVAYHRNSCSYDGISDNPVNNQQVEDVILSSPRAQREAHRQSLVNARDFGRTRSEIFFDQKDAREQLPCCVCPPGSFFDVGTVELINTPVEHLAFERHALIHHEFAAPIDYLCTTTSSSSSSSSDYATSSSSDRPDRIRRHGSSLTSLDVSYKDAPLKKHVKIILSLMIFICFIFIIYIANAESFEFIFGGLAGTALKIVEPDAVANRYSLIGIADALGENAGDGNGHVSIADRAGIVYLQLCYIVFSLFLPLVSFILLAFVWFTPLSLRESKIAFYILEIASAWAGLDIYVLSIIASVLEINQFSQFLAQDYCDPIKKVLPINSCFSVDTTLLPGVWVLLGTAIASWCVNQLITRLAERSIRDRELRLLYALSQEEDHQLLQAVSI